MYRRKFFQDAGAYASLPLVPGGDWAIARAFTLDTAEVVLMGADVKVIGIGEFGNRIVRSVNSNGVQSIKPIYSDTHVGIRTAIHETKMLFVVADMESETGIGAALVIARIAKNMGILTVGFVTKADDVDGGHRMSNVANGLANLEGHVDSLIVVRNENLQELPSNDRMIQGEASVHANDVFKNVVDGIAKIINVPGHVAVDLEDVRSMMFKPGRARIGLALANGSDRAHIAAERAMVCPLFDGMDLSSAKGVLVLISAAKGSLKMSETVQVMNTIRAYASNGPHVIYGTTYDESLGDQIRVTMMATGL